MKGFGPPFRSQQSPWLDRLQASLEVVLMSGFVSSFLASIPFSLKGSGPGGLAKDVRIIAGFVLLEASITFVLLILIMKVHRESLRDLGWRWDRWTSDALLGLGLVPILFGVNIAVAEGFRFFLPRYYTASNPLIETIRSPQDLALFMVMALAAGGIKEEMQRAFVLTRFRDHLGGAILGLILWSVVFGAGHYLQGLQGSAAAGLFGLLFGIVYLARRSLIAPIVAHSSYDTVALLGYWIFKGA